MSDISGLIGLNGAGKELIRQISGGVKGYAAPWQIRRIALAEADANEIKAESDGKIAQKNHEKQIELEELKERTVERIVKEYVEDQENIERIAISAAPKVNEDANINDMSPDFKRSFTENARLIYDEDMQKIWADILAGEANSPGSFSKKTLSILQTLEKSDAETFQKLCGFNCYIFDSQLTPVVLEHNGSIYDDNGINFIELIHLSNLGLIELDVAGNLGRNLKNPKFDTILFFFIYCDTFILFEINKNQSDFKNGYCLLTQSGQELAKICSPKKVEGFLEYVIKKINDQGCEIIGQYTKDNIPHGYREVLNKSGIYF